MINGITFSECLITSSDFAHFMYTMLGNTDGVTKGCEISVANDLIYVQKGYFIQSGRMVQVVGTEELATPEVQSGQLFCKVVFEIDLTKNNTADNFTQGYFKTLTSSAGYPEVTQEDMDDGGMIYQMPWATYTKTVNGVGDFKDVRCVYDQESIWKVIMDQHDEYKAEFEAYFAEQKAVVEKMINDLEIEGFATQEEFNELSADVEATKKSVSDGKGLIAAAITLKKIATAATDTFAQMAENIGKIVLGSGNAAKADVLAGKTFTNDDGVEYTGTMVDKSGTTQSATASLDATNSRLQMTIPATGKYSTTSKIYAAYSSIRTLIGLTADKLWPGVTILGVKSSKESMAGGTYTPTTAQRTISCGGKAMTSDIIIGAIPTQVWTGWKHICKHVNVATSMDSTPVDAVEYDLGADFAKYNTFIFRVVYTTGNSSGAVGTYTYQNTFVCTRKADDVSKHTIAPNKTSNASDSVVYRDLEYSVGVSSDNRTVCVDILYDGDSETAIRYGNFEVVLIAALTL